MQSPNTPEPRSLIRSVPEVCEFNFEEEILKGAAEALKAYRNFLFSSPAQGKGEIAAVVNFNYQKSERCVFMLF